MVGGEEWQEKVYDGEEWKKVLRTARNHRILHMAMENTFKFALSLPSTYVSLSLALLLLLSFALFRSLLYLLPSPNFLLYFLFVFVLNPHNSLCAIPEPQSP
jgi:hypothetical protein